MSENARLNEYKLLRQEIIVRIKLLHQALTLSTVLQIALLIFGYTLHTMGKEIVSYLLLVPIFLNFLTFNYQSNQMSLEAIAKYIHESLRPKVNEALKDNVWEWEQYFSNHRRYYKFEAFFKVLPLIFPNVIPLLILIKQVPLTQFQVVLMVFDLLLAVFVIENFRYKLRRVK